jgi:hypothetical protein
MIMKIVAGNLTLYHFLPDHRPKGRRIRGAKEKEPALGGDVGRLTRIYDHGVVTTQCGAFHDVDPSWRVVRACQGGLRFFDL